MPRKPTAHARQARSDLLELISQWNPDTPLPTTREFGTRFALHPSTIFRLLRDLSEEGRIWQSPQGRFYTVEARRRTMEGAPLCFVGREMWQWSRLYQEILEGVSEVCGANGSPLVLLSSRSLVQQESPAAGPRFAPDAVQKKELQRLLDAAPRGCAGFLFDHLWKQAALASVKFPGGERVQLLEGGGSEAEVLAPDYRAGARLVAGYLRRMGMTKVGLVIPFEGDPAIDHAGEVLIEELAGFSVTVFRDAGLLSAKRKALGRLDALVCLEDNTADALRERYPDGRPLLIATQGTGLIHAPQARVRIDYRRLGRSAASRILHGKSQATPKPILIPPKAGS